MTSVAELNTRANNHDKRADSHSRRLDGHDEKISDVDKRVHALEGWAKEVRNYTRVIFLAVIVSVIGGLYQFFTSGSRLNPAPTIPPAHTEKTP